MREIELWTEDGHFVAVVDIPPFPDHAMPKVVMWGSRVFQLNLNPPTEESGRWPYHECFAVYSLTASPGRHLTRACRACGKPLLAENLRMADGCPCNSARGVNHGLVAKDTCTCTCTECDPEETGSTRYQTIERAAERARAIMSEIDADALVEASKPRSGGLQASEAPPVDRSARCTVGEAIAPGVPNTEDRGDGQQKGYVVLCAEERAKGFVRPVRRTYRHVGTRPKHPLRELTEEEQKAHAGRGYAKYEMYPESMRPRLGRFWTASDLKSGCGSTTTMGQALAETYARDPAFYSGTMCCTCHAHFPVGKDGEFVWDGTDEKVGT